MGDPLFGRLCITCGERRGVREVLQARIATLEHAMRRAVEDIHDDNTPTASARLAQALAREDAREADCSICRQPGCTGGHACE